MRQLRLLVVLAIAAGCGDPPPFALRFRITPGQTAKCISPELGGLQATTCAQVTMPCDAVVSIRIVPPGDLTAPYISVCKTLTKRDVCAIGSVDLPQPVVPVPQQRLLVQMAIYPLFRLPKDPSTGQPRCPTDVAYAADGFPVMQEPPCDKNVADPDDPEFCWPTPAIGGTAYYTPGDPQTIVDLGCSNLDEFSDPKCRNEQETTVTTTVSDFDTPGVSVSQGIADILSIHVGEPKPAGGEFELKPENVAPLQRFGIVPPSWTGTFTLMLDQSACLEVTEETPQSTQTIACKAPVTGHTIDVPGVRMSKQTLSQILKAITDVTPTFTPDKGLVVGLVLDSLGNPAPGFMVSTDSASTIEYLSADRTRFVAGGTSTSGIFLSRDAPYGTTFTGSSLMNTASGYGGLVHGKVTIVILQLPPPTSGP